jgi:nucleoside-diphosphate-sugar epimerase
MTVDSAGRRPSTVILGHGGGADDPLTVAVTAVDTTLGRRVLAALDADPAVARVLGIGDRPIALPEPSLVFLRADLLAADLDTALHGVDAVVHIGPVDAAPGGSAQASARRVDATARVLDAAVAAGVDTVVHVSSALVYGADETTTVPLTEDAPLRADRDFPAAWHAARADALARAFAADHPELRVVVLRPVAMLGPGVDSMVTRHMESPVLPMVRGYDPPVQFVSTDDVADAVRVVVTDQRARGPFNVSAEGWLTTSDVRRLLARPTVHLPREVAFALAGALHRAGVLSVPPGALSYLMHPWVVDCSRLRGLGWAPRASHRDLLHVFGDEHRGWLSVGRVRVRALRAAAALGTTATLTAAGVALAAYAAWRRLVRRRSVP